MIKTVADFKRYLALTGPTVSERPALRMVSLEWRDFNTGEMVHQPVRNPNFRGIEKLQSNSLKFEGGSWLDIPKASEVEFDNDNQLITITQKDCRLVYKWANVAIVDR